MTNIQDSLADATTAYVEADRQLAEAMQRPGTTMTEIRPLWDAERAARHQYAAALTAAGHAVPVGLLDIA
jgi:hypothetical protein